MLQGTWDKGIREVLMTLLSRDLILSDVKEVVETDTRGLLPSPITICDRL